MKKYTLILIVLISSGAIAQNRLKSGELYPPGSSLWAPRAGVKGVVPPNWNGLLPSGEEIFLLSPTQSFAEIFIMISDGHSLDEVKNQWRKGMDFGSSYVIRPEGNVENRTPEIIASDLIMGNNTTGVKGYVEAKCGAYDVCITAILNSDPQNFEANKKSLQEFMDNLKFEKPSNENPYENFDWDPFLRNKQLVTFALDNKSSKETLVNLCGDGTFTAVFKKSGLFKDQGIKGKKKGTWVVNGTGPTTKLILTFNKLGPIETTLEIRDEKVYANGERYFVSASVECK